MDVRTTRFGTVTIAEDRVITFPKGLLGFSSCHKFCLLEPADDACFFWLQSMVREDAKRTILFDLDMSIQRLSTQVGLGDPSIVSLTGTYHNLLRAWAEI